MITLLAEARLFLDLYLTHSKKIFNLLLDKAHIFIIQRIFSKNNIVLQLQYLFLKMSLN